MSIVYWQIIGCFVGLSEVGCFVPLNVLTQILDLKNNNFQNKAKQGTKNFSKWSHELDSENLEHKRSAKIKSHVFSEYVNTQRSIQLSAHKNFYLLTAKPCWVCFITR